MDTEVMKDKTCLDCEYGNVDITHGGVHCAVRNDVVVQWFTTPINCLDFKRTT